MYRLPPFGDILRETFGRFFQEWVSALVLSLVYGALSVLVIWPVSDRLIAAAQMPVETRVSFLTESGLTVSTFLLIGFLIFLFYSALNVIWVRSVLISRDDALSDGAYSLFLRTVLVAWRQIVAVGWLIVAVLLGILLASVSNRWEVVIIVLVPAVVAIAPAVGVAIVGAAVDEPVTIRRAIAILGPNIFKMMVPAIFLGLIAGLPGIAEAFQTAQSVSEPVDPEITVSAYLTYRFFRQVLDALVTFLWLTLSGVVLGHALEGEES